jgi:hypothetical protein
MEGWQLAVGFVFVVGALGGALYQLQDDRVLEALKRARHRPRPVIIVTIELVMLLAVAYLATTTARWAAVAWTVVGVLVALVLFWTTRQILRMPAPAPALAEPQPAEPAAPAQRVPIKQPYLWAKDPSDPPLLMHAVPIAGGAPEPRAYCGHEYDRSTLGAIWIPQDFPARHTCKICRAVLVKAGYVPF